VSTSLPERADLILPKLFLDRSLGRIIVARGLRAAGVDVITLAEYYGVPADEQVSDADWLHVCGRQRWAALKADANIRRRTRPERLALVEARVQTFVINAQLTGQQKVDRILANLPAIAEACRSPGPFVYRIHPERLQLLSIPSIE
jgi:PIN like domain